MDRKRFEGKAAIVTGGSSGIGRACVEKLCGEGCKVVFSGISEGGYETEKELKAKGFDVFFLRGDMSSWEFCGELVDYAAKVCGRIDYLVNNAFPFTTRGEDAERSDWEHVMEAGPFAYAAMVKLTAPHMRAQGKGAVVNMCSISGHIAQPNRWTYNGAKGAVKQMTRCMAMDLAPVIRVNAVSPGWIWTREVAKAAVGGREKWEPVWGRFHLMRRLGEASEVADAVAFLLSDEAGFITGADLPVDGGYLAMGSEGLGENSVFEGSD